MTKALAHAPERRLAPVHSAGEARAALAASRARLEARLHALEDSVARVADWRETIRRNPLLTLGGAFLVGFGLARLFSRR